MQRKSIVSIIVLAVIVFTLTISTPAVAVMFETPADIDDGYQILIDEFNNSMSEDLYKDLTLMVSAAPATGDIILAAFICQYLYNLYSDFVTLSTTDFQAKQNYEWSLMFKDTRDGLIQMWSVKNDGSDELWKALQKCADYYMRTDTRVKKRT